MKLLTCLSSFLLLFSSLSKTNLDVLSPVSRSIMAEAMRFPHLKSTLELAKDKKENSSRLCVILKAFVKELMDVCSMTTA